MSGVSFSKSLQQVPRWLALASGLMLAGCGPLISFGDDGPADQIFSLDYPAARPHLAGDTIIYVEEPLMSGGLSGTQVSVTLDNNQHTSLMGIRWSANTTDMIRDYLVRGLSSRSGARMLGEGALDVQAGCRMGLKVWAYEYVPGDSSADDTIDVEIEFILVRYLDNGLLGQPTFSASEPVAGSDGTDIVAGFDAAMRSISRQAGDWLQNHLEACKL